MDESDGAGRWQRPASTLLASQTAAAFGTALAQFAITWHLTLETESGVIMALSIVFGMLPQAVVSVVGGVLADRMSKRRLIIASHAGIALATVGLAAAMSAGVGGHGLIFFVLAIRSVGAGLRAPAVSALVPQLVPASQLLRVNGAFQTAQSAVSILSPMAAAAALATTSITAVLLVDVAVSTAAIGLVAATSLPPVRAAAAGTRWRRDLAEGVQYTRQHTFVRWVFALAVVVVLLGAAPAYLVPLRIARSFGGALWMLGGSQIAVSLGTITVGLLAAVLGQRLRLTVLLAAAPALFGAASLVLGLSHDIWPLFGAMFVAGAALAVATGLSATLLQERVAPAYLGRVFGLFGLVLFAMPLGLVVFGPLADVVPVENLFVGSGAATFAAAAAILLSPSGRAALRDGLAPRRPAPATTTHKNKKGMRSTMKKAKDKYVVLGSDFAGFPLKEAVKGHLLERGWTVEDLTPELATAPMYHRAGFLVASKIAEGEYEKALAFCGTGMGIHIAASKVPHVHAAVAESLPAAQRAATANNANLLAMGAFWTAAPLAQAMADAFLESSLGDGYEDWPGFYEYHQRGYQECEDFDYEAYKASGFQVPDPSVPPLAPEPRGLAY
ncbi:MAG: MFS transporter [Propionibacteriaceae bacterium]|nr:MFS transporter [Propionibacteriaceae bacterium]